MLIYPSYFEIDDAPDAKDYIYNNVTIKMGQVIKANFPNTEKNKNSFITYDVFIYEQSGKEINNSIVYDCIPAQMFGSAADYLEYSYRSNTDKDNQEDLLTDAGKIDLSSDESIKKLLGAAVLVAFVGGDTSKGIIVSGIPNFFLDKNKQYTFQNEDMGKFLNFAFNGTKVNINKDGELLLVVNGPTTAEGKLDKNSDKKKVGSFIKINKDGEIIISTTSKTEVDSDFVKAPDDSKADNKITIKKDGSIEIKIEDKNSLTLKKTDKDAELTLGDGAKSVAIAEALKDMYDQLKQKLDMFDNHIHPSGMGPTGTPNPTISAPSWNDDIVSKRMKLPK